MRSTMRPVTDATYKTFIRLLKGNFRKPVNERSIEEKNAIVRFWRQKEKLSLRSKGGKYVLLYDGKKLLKESDLSTRVQKQFKAGKGCGARAVAYSLKRKFAGCSERKVKQVLKKNKRHNRLQATFTNKLPHRAITASKIFERVQIDLLGMRKNQIVSNGQTYKYILTVVDVFSRFVFLRALPSKSAVNVAAALNEIFLVHGWPKLIQCDNGTEFRGAVATLLNVNSVRVIHSRPYHPQSQGKVERQNRIVKNKIKYDIMSRGSRGYNWVESLPKIAKAMNDLPKEVLAYHSPFEIYFGRGGKCNSVDEVRAKAHRATERCIARDFALLTKQLPCSVYKKGDKILVKYPFQKSRVPKKTSVLKGIVLSRGKHLNKYKVRYRLLCGTIKTDWVGVDFITSRTRDEEKMRRLRSKHFLLDNERRHHHRNKYYIVADKPSGQFASLRRQQHRAKYYIPLERSTQVIDPSLDNASNCLPEISYFCNNDRVRLLLDPKGIGSCQFDAVADQLKCIGVMRTGKQLRRIAVEHLQKHKDDYASFIDINIDDYIVSMLRSETYGDNLTLIALAREFNCQFFLFNALGENYHRMVSNSNVFDCNLPLLTLGYQPEGHGEHYLSVDINNHYMQTLLSPFQVHVDTVDRETSCDETECSDHELLEVRDENVFSNDSSIQMDMRHESPGDVGSDLGFQPLENRNLSPIPENSSSEEIDRPYLPDEILIKIVVITIKLYPYMRYPLQRVCLLFEATTQAVGYPTVHISPSVLAEVPRPVSVSRLSRLFGRYSGVMLQVRSILRGERSRWFTAWLWLSNRGYGWYEVRDITWR